MATQKTKAVNSESPNNDGATIKYAGATNQKDKSSDLSLGYQSNQNTGPKRREGVIPIFSNSNFAKGDRAGSVVSLQSQININETSPDFYNISQIGQTIQPSGFETSYDKWLGFTVSSSANTNGTIIAYGAPRGEITGTQNEGYVRVHQYDGTTWKQLGGDIVGESKVDESGRSVSLDDDGDTVVVGAWYNDGWMTSSTTPSGYNQGHARVFRYSSGSWSQLGSDIEPEQYNVAASGDQFGEAVSINGPGDRVVIGAPQLFSAYRGSDPSYLNDDSRDGEAGYAEVYTYGGSSWSKTGSRLRCFEPTPDDNFGRSVSINQDGSIVAIGCPQYQYQTADDKLMTGKEEYFSRGVVEAFKYNETSSDWDRLGSPIHGKISQGQFGEDVSLSDDGLTLAIAGMRDYEKGAIAGRVEVYQYVEDAVGGEWVQKGSSLLGEYKYDYYGYSVSISQDGSILAVGATGYDGGGGAGTNDSQGKTYVYKYDSDWILINAIEGTTLGDYFGFDVATVKKTENDDISLTVGVPYVDDEASNMGEVRSYLIQKNEEESDKKRSPMSSTGRTSQPAPPPPNVNYTNKKLRFSPEGKAYSPVSDSNGLGGREFSYIDPSVSGGETVADDSSRKYNKIAFWFRKIFHNN